MLRSHGQMKRRSAGMHPVTYYPFLQSEYAFVWFASSTFPFCDGGRNHGIWVLSMQNADLEMKFEKPVQPRLYLGKSLRDALNKDMQRMWNRAVAWSLVATCKAFCDWNSYLRLRVCTHSLRSVFLKVRPQRESLHNGASRWPITVERWGRSVDEVVRIPRIPSIKSLGYGEQ